MAEITLAGEHHGETGRVRRIDDLLVTDRATGLDHAGHTGLDCGIESVSGRKERVGDLGATTGTTIRRRSVAAPERAPRSDGSEDVGDLVHLQVPVDWRHVDA